MGDLCNYIEILIVLNLCRPLVGSTENYTYVETFDNEGNEYPIPRVVNGEKARLGQFPYQIALKQLIEMDRFMTFCGGALIAPNKILSAAHCFVIEANWCERKCAGKKNVIRLDSKYAVAGTIKNQETKYRYYKQQWRTMSSTLIPPTYSYPKDDIAVVFTVNPFDLNEYVNTIPFAQENKDYGNIKCNVTGYGKLSISKPSPILMWATLELIGGEECTSIHKQMMSKFICTKSYYTDVLEGDSGGPLVCFNTFDANDEGHGVVVGVVTGKRKPGGTFFTRVSPYHAFITKNNASIPRINMTCLCILISYNIKFFL